MRRLLAVALIGSVFLPQAGSGQSLFGRQGLGIPMDPVGARARALGSSGVGLLGPSLSPVDLAAAAWIFLPTAQVTMQPQWVDVTYADQSASTTGTRFPDLGLAYPLPSLNGTALLHISSLFDQRWEVQEAFTEELGGEDVSVTDVFKSDGGISTIQLGWAQRVGEDLSLGFGIGTRIGSVTRRFTRLIDAQDITGVSPFLMGGEWQFDGLAASLGFQWDPIQALRLGGAVNWSGDLKAKPVAGTDGESVSSDLPMEYRLGASGILTPRLALFLGLSFSKWEDSGGFLGDGEAAGSVWSYGGGVEWAGPQMGTRNFPLRLGVKRSDLPFTFEGETPTENLISGGVGLNLVPAGVGFVGTVDIAFERGERKGGSLSESFWRASLTFRVGSF